MTALWWTWQGFAVTFGLVIGSFLNVCIARMPEDRSVVAPGSHCERCQQPIRWFDNVPVLSYVLLKGRCRHCDTPIGASHPLVEVLGGLMAWLLFRRFVPDPALLDLPHVAAWGVYFGFASLLIVATYVDLRHRIIPDPTSSWAVPLGVASVALLAWLGYDGWLATSWRSSVLGAAFGGGFFAVTGLLARFLSGREALGFGDVKLIAMIGAFLGPLPGVLLVMLIGSLIGSVIGILATLILWRRPMLPFGPPLAIGALVYVLYGDLLLRAFFPAMAAWR